jgi:glycosyltransferase involved in cell wall biosynthesis
VGRLRELIRRERIDLVHVHSDLDRKYAQAAALATGTPVVGHLHAEWNHLAPMLPDQPGALRRARAERLAEVRRRVEQATVRHYIAESARVRDLFEPLVHGTPITVLDQAIPIDRFDRARAAGAREAIRAELRIPRGHAVLVNVSRLVPGKGHDALLRVFAAVHDRVPETALVVVGDGELRGDLERSATALGLDGAVHLTGARDDVPAVLAAGDLFVFTSESEGFGMAVLEAMAATLPVVAFRLPAFEEFAEDGVTATLVPLGDEGALHDAVLDLLADPRRGRAMGAAGRLVVDTRFDPAAVTRTFESVYRSVLAPTTYQMQGAVA